VAAAYRNLERKPEAMSDKFWLFKNLVAVLDRHREAGRIVEYAAVERTPARPLVNEEGLPDPAAVAELVENGSIAEDTMRVRDAVRSLSYPARLAFVLSQIGNFTYRQTASLTGLTFDDVRDYLHRARRRIRDELLESCPV
jgi:RNA polymerase sigma factor (sigma-70 family)